MTAAPLPDSWDDEPWPLDDPVPAPSMRPTTWSDTHDQPPQVADLADEAWQYAIDHGCSIERALVELQDQKMHPQYATGGIIPSIHGIDPGAGVTFHWVTPADPQAPTPEEIQAGVDLTEFLSQPAPPWGLKRLLDDEDGA